MRGRPKPDLVVSAEERKAFCLFMRGMDKTIGPDFEKGLAQLDATLSA